MKGVGKLGPKSTLFQICGYKGALEKLLQARRMVNQAYRFFAPSSLLPWPYFWCQEEDQLGVIQVIQIINSGSTSCVF